MAKEADPALADEEAGKVVRACEDFAQLALDVFDERRKEKARAGSKES